MGERKGKRVTHDAGFGPSFRRVTMRIIEMRDGVEIVAERLVTGFEAASKNKNKVWGFNLYKIKLFCASIMSY